MNVRISLLIAASLALAGCPDKPVEKPAAPAPKVAAAPPPPPPAAPPEKAAAMAPATAKTSMRCTGACDVTVTVTKTATGCRVEPVVDRIHVQPGPAPTIIKWQLAGASGYKFAQPHGIAFNKPSGAPPGGVMQNGAGGGTAVTVTDKHTGPATKGEWAYTVLVTDGTAKCEYDPWVDNN